MADDRAPIPAGPATLEPLNAPQAEAVAHAHGPLIVFAGAGSGKTRVITYRIANLVAVHRVPPYRLLAVTFTNKAAQEMRERLDRLLGASLTRDLWVGTFHAVCARLLRRFHDEAGIARDFVIYDTSDQKALLTRVMRELDVDEKRYPPAKVLARIGREKQEARGPSEMVPGSYVDEVVQRCFAEYEKRLRESSAVDFEDLLLHVLRLAENPDSAGGRDLRTRFSHVLVDEFQDVNHVQYRLVRAFGAAEQNICVVGDDDQSIYQWRGADVRNIRGFTQDFPDAKLVKLEQNYRSSGRIVRAALGVIRPSTQRVPKELWTANPDGHPVTVVHAATERDEAAWVVGCVKKLVALGLGPRSVAVFYRVHAQSRVLEEAMRHAQVPYQIVGGTKFFERAEVKDLLAYLRVLLNPRSEIDLLRIINNPPRKLGAKTVEELRTVARSEGCSLLEAIEPLCRSDRVNAGTKQRLREFDELVRELARRAETAAPHELAEEVLERTGYAAALEADDSAEGDARLDNLRELLGSIAEYEQEQAEAGEAANLSDYLARVSLTAEVDTLNETPRVPMMTVHASKGLEFDAVFLTGLEERLFPLRGTELDADEREIEEERRLAYVAITRARREIYVTHTQTRTIYGQVRYNEPSRFLANLPPEEIRQVRTESMRETVSGTSVLGLARAGSGSLGQGLVRNGASLGYGHGLGAERGGGNGRDRSAAREPLHRETPSWEPYERAPAPLGARPGGMSRARGAAASGPRRGAPSGPPRRPGERYVERDESVDSGEVIVQIGARVRHKQFGVGVVQQVDGATDPTVTVAFPGWPAKRIKVRFLEPA